MPRKEYEVQTWDSNVVVKDSGDDDHGTVHVRGKGTGNLDMKLAYATEDAHGESLYGTVVVGGPAYLDLQSDKQDAIEEAVKKHFGMTSVLHGDGAYKSLIGEYPPWNPDGEGVDE